MSHNLVNINDNKNCFSTYCDDDSCHDIEKNLLISLKYEDTVFICSDRQYLANKLAISKYSSRIRKLIMESDKVVGCVNLPDVFGYDFFLFKYFVYTNELYPLSNMSHYYDISYIFESESLKAAFFKYLATDNGNIMELLELLKFQRSISDPDILSILLNSRKLSLEKLRTSNILIEMDVEELQKFNFASVIRSWGALEAFSFIEFWIFHSKEKRTVFRDYLYRCVDLSTFDLQYSRTIPNNLFHMITNMCRGPEQKEYVRRILEQRQNSLSEDCDCNSTIDYKSFDIDFWRRQDIKKLTQECGDVSWFKIVVDWYSYDEENNVHYLVEMLQHVDFEQIDSSLLTSWVTHNETILHNKNIYKFFIPYIMRSPSETGCESDIKLEKHEQQFERGEFLGGFPDSPMSLLYRDFPSSIDDLEENDLFASDNYNDSSDEVFRNHLVEYNSFSNNNTRQNIKQLSLRSGEKCENNVVSSKSDSNETSNIDENFTALSICTDDVFNGNFQIDDLENRSISQKKLESTRLEDFVADNHVGVKNKSSKSLKNYDNQKKSNEVIHDVKVLMIGGVSGIKKEELKPARNLFYSSKSDEYEYLSELNRDRTLTKIAEYGGYLFAVGEFCQYDKINDCWNEIDTCLQSPRYEHDVAVVGDKMYIIGGNNMKTDKYAVVEYNFDTDQFMNLETTANDYIYQHSNIVKDNVIYVVGGYKFSQSRLLQRFDPRIGKFEMLSTPFNPHLHSGTVLHGERIYCSGGRHTTRETSLPMHYNNAYDIRSNKWVQLSSMPTARSGCGSSVIGDKIFVFGGFTKSGGTLKIVETYDIPEDKWRLAKPMAEERGSFGIHTMYK
uniref:BTB domain-containing protein n=1 Tax=Strongyloides papillosus TaxID=174720 RepID=A0A0N5BAZ1_STREA